MPKKKLQETQQEQSARFKKTVRDLVRAGELSPIETDVVMGKMLKGVAQKRQESRDSSKLD